MCSFVRRCACLAGALTAIALTSGTANAQHVAYINNQGGSVSYLATTFGMTVTNLNNPSGLTLADLAPYDAIIIASNATFTQPANISNVAKQFADSGHGVVLTEFDFQGGWNLGGGIMGPGYSPLSVDPGSNYFITSGLGTVYDPSSPLLSGINLANVKTQYQAISGVTGTLVADWSTGRPAIAYNSLANSSVVGLNLFPDAAYSVGTDNHRLLANAVTFSMNSNAPASTPEPSSLMMCGTGLMMFSGFRWRMRRRRARA